MKRRHYKYFVIVCLLVFLTGCSEKEEDRSKLEGFKPASASEAASAPDRPVPKPKENRTITSKPLSDLKRTRQYSFVVQGGIEVQAWVVPYGNNGTRKIITFAPPLNKTDGNLYSASLSALHNIYGKQRGLFQLSDAQTEYDGAQGINYITWHIVNPTQQFCVFPIKDTEQPRITGLVVWVR